MRGTTIGRLGPEAQKLIKAGKRKGEDQATTLDRRIAELQRPAETYRPHPLFENMMRQLIREELQKQLHPTTYFETFPKPTVYEADPTVEKVRITLMGATKGKPRR